MKQEMQGQMVFQNKIRALKQIELSKYGGKEPPPQNSTNDVATNHKHDNTEEEDHANTSTDAGASSNGLHSHSEGQPSEHADICPLEADPDWIWKPEDDQIFDFLMDH